jgi:uncharacterized membrane protein
MQVKVDLLADRRVRAVLLHLLAFAINFITVALLFHRAHTSEGAIQNACYAIGVLDLVAICLQLQWGLRTLYSATRPADQGNVEW